ncbi:16S rRNA (uracil(1498)-N(3))-methyltransferase [Alkalicoccus daliensis]|uniref:Ribosomal RNA small subunit methyltransferase E n=1 Tax=Alkalicoccus daliensis TaxID=745820 RepID=A0A1H0BDQ3_9BACI|nr:16S rRNA (uracil(1498)-N(3))-methyltransferase [Alkalicoccus daliensis]SDN43757.1 16S rRNA (uracil1498-N3)-methyltransferase [Alkalicoccus daliensis]
MQRYFLADHYFQNGKVTFSEETTKHISRVMRMKAGARLIVCNEHGACFTAELTEEEPLSAKIIEEEKDIKELPVQVTIAQGLPKGDKLEYVIQKGTELGAASFLPFTAARSIVKFDDKKAAKKIERWQKIAQEASEQAHRSRVPLVKTPVNFSSLCKEAEKFDHIIAAYEESAKIGEKTLFNQTLQSMSAGDKILVIIGPEGGLSEKEAASLEEHQAMLCSFGPRILRTETAPLYALAALSYYFELSR